MNDATSILNSLEAGDPLAADQLLPLVYDELRRLAALRMSAEPDGQTLQPTALVHEAWLRLAGGTTRGRIAATFAAPPPRPCGGF